MHTDGVFESFGHPANAAALVCSWTWGWPAAARFVDKSTQKIFLRITPRRTRSGASGYKRKHATRPHSAVLKQHSVYSRVLSNCTRLSGLT